MRNSISTMTNSPVGNNVSELRCLNSPVFSPCLPVCLGTVESYHSCLATPIVLPLKSGTQGSTGISSTQQCRTCRCCCSDVAIVSSTNSVGSGGVRSSPRGHKVQLRSTYDTDTIGPRRQLAGRPDGYVPPR